VRRLLLLLLLLLQLRRRCRRQAATSLPKSVTDSNADPAVQHDFARRSSPEGSWTQKAPQSNNPPPPLLCHGRSSCKYQSC
jgi:hypothetical protein